MYTDSFGLLSLISTVYPKLLLCTRPPHVVLVLDDYICIPGAETQRV